MLSDASPRAVAIGSGVAVVATILGYIGALAGLRASQDLPAGAPVLITAGSFVMFLLVGALAFAVGGFVAGRLAGDDAAPNGVGVAAAGVVVLAILGVVTFFFIGGMMIIMPLAELLIILAIVLAIGFGLASAGGVLGARVALALTSRGPAPRPARTA